MEKTWGQTPPCYAPCRWGVEIVANRGLRVSDKNGERNPSNTIDGVTAVECTPFLHSNAENQTVLVRCAHLQSPKGSSRQMTTGHLGECET